MGANHSRPEILSEDRLRLVALAKSTIAEALGEATSRPPLLDRRPFTLPWGAFVTIKSDDGNLRGCIGRFPVPGQRESLAQVVRESAVAAAFHDPRFVPVTPAEWPKLTVSVSVIPQMERTTTPPEFVPGVHGLALQHGTRSGTLLPQVATEYGLGSDEFIDAVARKAGVTRAEALGPAAVWRRYEVIDCPGTTP